MEEESIAKTPKEIGAAEKLIACKYISDRDGISEKIEGFGVKVDYVGTIISSLIKDGYMTMVFWS
ncbi:MAG: hypothetical protein U9N83_03780 [Thermodesulfobacteriota bacterium]|nr:hypothetical protein [Thermodesulfobacteriota bacterium]